MMCHGVFLDCRDMNDQHMPKGSGFGAMMERNKEKMAWSQATNIEG